MKEWTLKLKASYGIILSYTVDKNLTTQTTFTKCI